MITMTTTLLVVMSNVCIRRSSHEQSGVERQEHRHRLLALRLWRDRKQTTIMVKLSQCLADLGITDASAFDNCDNVDDEIKIIKKIYFKLALTQHPVSKT